MDKYHRKDGNLALAFRRQAREMKLPVPSAEAAADDPVAAGCLAPEPTWKSGVRRALRMVARPAWRLVRPFVRGPAHRLRHFMAQPILIELDAVRERLRQDIINTETWAHEQQLRLTASVVQEIVASRTALARELGAVLDRQVALERDLAAANDALRAALDANARSSASVEKVLRIAGSTGPLLERVETYAMKSAARGALSLGHDVVMIRTAVGYMLCDANDTALVAHLYEAGELEPGTRLLIERMVKPGSVFVDVGANTGMHTVAAARAMQGDGRIIAFEPFPRTIELLGRSLWMNGMAGMCELHALAVSDRPGEQTLFLGQTSGHHSLFPLPEEGQSSHVVSVGVTTLDAVLGSTHVDLIKIDAEGAELDVLRGAKHLLSANPQLAMIVELGPSHLARTGVSVESWLREFSDAGFAFEVIDPVTGALAPAAPEELAVVDSVNLYMRRSAG